MTSAVGDYEATELLGGGSSAQVWRGRQVSTDRPVALKVFPADQLAAVRREAALAAAVDHPHVVTVLDVVSDDNRAVLVTEYAAGGDLADLLARRGRLTAGQTLTVLIPLAAALATAHERQMVHGDVSAQNIVFDGAGRPLLADLGAARAAMESGRPVQATPCDAAPELVRSGPPTPATDLFSLGSVALACLVGRPAWPADDLRDVLIQAAAGQWPDLPDDAAPAALVAAVRALLEHDPERRPGAASLVLDLRSAGRPEPLDLSPGARVGGAGISAVEPADPPSKPEARAGWTGASARGRHGRHHERPAQDAAAPPWVTGTATQRTAGDPIGGGDPDIAERGRALTRLRSDAAPRGSGSDPDDGRWYQRLRRPIMPLRSRRSRRALRVTALTAAALAVAVAAGLAGLRWADSGRADPVAVQQLSAAQDVSTGVPGASGRPSARTVPPAAVPTAPHTTAVLPTTGAPTAIRPSTGPARTASAPVTATSAAPRRSAGSFDPAASADWTATVQALDLARSRALVRRDPALLDAVYTRDSAARSADVQTIRTLVAHGLRVSGAQHQVQSVQPVSGAPATVLVRDSMPSYDVLGATGSVVGHTPQRAAARRVMVLVATSAGYRISDVRAAGSTAPGG